MKSQLLDIPSDRDELPHWLEQEIVGEHLGVLAHELALVHGSALEPASEEELSQWLGSDRQILVERGLTALPAAKTQQLLSQPALLFPLQEFVFVHGGSHWQRLLGIAPPPMTVTQANTRPARGVPYRWIAALAASLLLALGVVWWSSLTQSGDWGWNRGDLLAGVTTREQYLLAVADAASDWFEQPRESDDELRRAIEQMQLGCDRVISQTRSSQLLDDEDRAWLLEKCQAWRAKFDDQLAALSSGAEPEQVRESMDATIRKLQETLRARASTPT